MIFYRPPFNTRSPMKPPLQDIDIVWIWSERWLTFHFPSIYLSSWSKELDGENCRCADLGERSLAVLTSQLLYSWGRLPAQPANGSRYLGIYQKELYLRQRTDSQNVAAAYWRTSIMKFLIERKLYGVRMSVFWSHILLTYKVSWLTYLQEARLKSLHKVLQVKSIPLSGGRIRVEIFVTWASLTKGYGYLPMTAMSLKVGDANKVGGFRASPTKTVPA